MEKVIRKKIQIKYSVRESPCIDIPLVEFMSSVFKEFHKIVKIRGDSMDILRISDDPMVYHIILFESDNSNHKIVFGSFLKQIDKLAKNSNCLPDKLSVENITNVPYSNKNHPELREGEIWITNSSELSQEVGWKTKRCGKTAYDVYGKSLKYLVPVFAQKFEIEAKSGKK